jgi:hypothetical protein
MNGQDVFAVGASFSSSSSNPAARSDGVLEYWSTSLSPNCTRVAGRDAVDAVPSPTAELTDGRDR